VAAAQPRIVVLDGFRAVGVLLVMGFHYGPRWSHPWTNQHILPYGDMLSGITPLLYGRSHACMFFILSGFVILLTLERCTSVLDFWRKRVARLQPTLILCASITTVMIYFFAPHEWIRDPVSFVLSVLMIDPDVVQPWFNYDVGWVDGAYWTLAVEARFYLLVAALFLVGRKAFLPVWLGLTVAAFMLGHPAIARSEELKPLRLILMPIWTPYFTVGICLFEIYRAKAWRLLPTIGFLGAAAMVLINAYWWTRFAHEDPIGRTIVNACWILAFVLFTIESPLVRPLGWKPLVVIGGASYSLFLLHEAAGASLMRPFEQMGVWPPLILVISVVSMVGLSLAIHKWFEEPARRFLLKASEGMVERVAASAPWLNYATARPASQVSHGPADPAA
jgi:peptidoglycan/LPS O-acetylase OafA/YrhL